MKRFAHRPWGWWLVLWRKPKFKIKLLYFKEGGAISMQRHKYRKELWLFLKGRGTNLRKALKKGDYLLIERLDWHKFIAEKRTVVLEIQYGELCCESDIERRDG